MDFITYQFVAAGTVAITEPGKIYIDVGNGFGPGLLDHHQSSAPAKCSAALALNHPEYIHSQVLPSVHPETHSSCHFDARRNLNHLDKKISPRVEMTGELKQILSGGTLPNPLRVQIITHFYPDMDAISGVYFARAHLNKHFKGFQNPHVAAFTRWADYVHTIDRGETALNPAQPIAPYSVFMMTLHQAKHPHSVPEPASAAMLTAGLAFVDAVIAKLALGHDMSVPAFFADIDSLQTEVAAVREDHQRYLDDMSRAELFDCTLPSADGQGVKKVPGLWINKPSSILFKAWARGDAERAGHKTGFVFIGMQLNPQRAILSVMPDSGVNLKGLGAALERAETAKRAKIDKVRTGTNRPGYDSPDPWYDGRSPLHAYTIVDAPREGSVLTEQEIRQVFEEEGGRGKGKGERGT